MSSSKQPLYPEVNQTNPEANLYSDHHNPSSSLYPTIDMKDLAENLVIREDAVSPPYSPPPRTFEEVLIRVPGVIVHLIEKDRSLELACGELAVVGLWQGENIVAVLARVGDELQWPLARDEAAVKLDESHYFFALRVPVGDGDEDGGGKVETLNYGLTIASKGQKDLLKNFDGVLEKYSCFSVQKVKGMGNWGDIDGSVAKGVSPEEMMRSPEKKEMVEGNSAAYWTTLAPNVEDYSSRAAKLIAAGSGQLIRGILWCGDVTVDRLKWGNEFFKKRMGPRSDSVVSPETMRRIKRVKKMTRMSEKVATGVLTGVVKVSGFFTGAIVNSAVGKKFFNLLPGEIVLASLDGFTKVFDAIEVAGRSVLATSSDVTTELVSQKYGDQAGKATSDGLGAAGHAFGTAWAVFKIRKAFNPKSVVNPTTLAKAAAKVKSEGKAKKKSSKKSS